MEAISFGGGVNSVAMTVMLGNEGWRGPVVMAETGCEWPETYSYADMFDREWLRPRGLSITRISAEYRSKSFSCSLLEYCENRAIVPAKTHRWCTHEWKIKPLARWAKANDEPTLLVGIAADESHRSPDRERPLCDRHITRDGCKRIIAEAGLPVPPKSGCVMCFFQPVEQWRELWRKHPDMFERVARLDDAMFAKRGYTLLQDGRKEPLRLRTLVHGFEAQDELIPAADLCKLEHLRCWACFS